MDGHSVEYTSVRGIPEFQRYAARVHLSVPLYMCVVPGYGEEKRRYCFFVIG